jgi:hypothetical protein
MSPITKQNAKLAAACSLLRTLANEQDEDAQGMAEKAIRNGAIGLIEEVISR